MYNPAMFLLAMDKHIMSNEFLDYTALFFLIFATVVMFYGVIAIHDIPYEIAKKRNHPHLEAIHYAGWVSLFTLHVIWPFLWIWATLWHKENGWGNGNHQAESENLAKLNQYLEKSPEWEKNNDFLRQELIELNKKLHHVSERLSQIEQQPPVQTTNTPSQTQNKE